jgi:hypothetical protein
MTMKLDINGMGVFVEVYKRKEELTDIEMLKEADKAIRRRIMEYESRTNGSTNWPADND